MSDHSYVPAPPTPPQPYGLMVEFEEPAQLLTAAEKVRDAGYKKWDTFTPYPVHHLDAAMGMKDTPLPWVVLGAGLFGCIGSMFLMLFANWWDYSFYISGKPFWSLPANVPVMFECTVLLAGITAFVCVWHFSGLPKLYHPVFTSERFLRANDDRFFLLIECADPNYDATKTRELCDSLGGSHVEMLED